MQNLFDQLILEALLKITGPAILYKPEKVIVKGPIGTSHMMLWDKLRIALAKKLNISPDKADNIIDTTDERDLITGFMTSEGKFVNRQQAWNIAKEYKKNVQDMAAQGFGAKMASEYL